MNELFLRQCSGGLGAGMDVTAVLAFIVVSLTYLLVPVIGYRPDRLGGMVASLYLLIAYAGTSIIQFVGQWVQLVDHKNSSLARDEGMVHFLFFCAVAKMTLFLLAMVTFVSGLRSLRLRRPEDAAPFESFLETRR